MLYLEIGSNCDLERPVTWICSANLLTSFYMLGTLVVTQLTFTCSKTTIETLEKGVKYVQS